MEYFDVLIPDIQIHLHFQHTLLLTHEIDIMKSPFLNLLSKLDLIIIDIQFNRVLVSQLLVNIEQLIMMLYFHL